MYTVQPGVENPSNLAHILLIECCATLNCSAQPIKVSMVEILECVIAGYWLEYSTLSLRLWEQIWHSNMTYKKLWSPKLNVKIGSTSHHSAMQIPLWINIDCELNQVNTGYHCFSICHYNMYFYIGADTQR